MATETRPREHAHPGPLKYVVIAIILAAITAVEVWAVYQTPLRDVLLPTLFVLSATKFALVAMFFMHLRFDHRLFTVFFVGGLVLAIGVLFALAVLFKAFT
ncbi:MAG: cytochrome C oxidase subunit IV [Dehalococcoidia bacterium]|nr:cytochrome C oxidase subunit IV [Dehalococcoidia bacterium]